MTLNWNKASKCIGLQGVVLLVLIAFSFTQPLLAQGSAIDTVLAEKGKGLFSSCAACHNPKIDITGPKLEGVTAKWIKEVGDFEGKSGEEWLYDWIKNYNIPIDAGIPYAKEMLNFAPSDMQLNLTLSDEDIKAILYYSDNSDFDKIVVADTGVVVEDKSPGYVKWLLVFLIVALLIAVLALSKISKTLKSAAQAKSGVAETDSDPFYKSGWFKTLIVTLFLTLVVYLLASQAIALGRQQGYQPMQPIKYSHALHAGEYEIDCKYCHTGASEGKHSNIPSQNMCMNCHKMIKAGPKYGGKELAKVYASIGFNPNRSSYFDQSKTTEEQYRTAYKKFLDKDAKSKNKDVKPATEEDLDAVMAMLNKPIEWVRVHNLPDHVYFNHAQHVEVGNVECQTCHGNVEEMEVVKQHAPLSMGWCINCHRNTEIDLGNDYYKDFDNLHEMKKLHNSVTVEDIGGAECQKCHY